MRVPTIDLSDIDVDDLTLIVERLVWREGVDHSRWVFQTPRGAEDGLVYKIWNPGYIRRDNLLTGLETGLYNADTIPALKAVIMSKGLCRGYVMGLGFRPSKPSPDLVYALWEATRTSQYFTAQYRLKHTITYQGRDSLIDLEAAHAVHGDAKWPIGKVSFEDDDYAALVRRLQTEDLSAQDVRIMADHHIAGRGKSSAQAPWLSRKFSGARKRLTRFKKVSLGDNRHTIIQDF